ncbi:MAG: phage terminase large subunit [Candidatus Izemoplasmatales bacterium]|nr:phage terminase large subunit [Candidatus Izemoplasmatales bacterium]
MHEWEDRLLANIDLAAFIQRASGGAWDRADHLDLLCHALEAVERGDIRRVIVTMPPRHGKSEVVSKHLPAWYLGLHPDREVILTSYSAELAQDHSRVAREVLREQGPPVFGVSVAQDSAAVNRWGVEGHRGGMIAVGIGGSITGRGAHLAIIDDPFKGPEDSHSPTQRKRVIDWYRTVLRTRLAPGGAIIVIHTRWHKGDLVGHLLAEAEVGGEQWTVIDLPAIAEEGDLLGRAPGVPLWPERFPLADLQELQRTLTTYWWQAVYQQKPGDPEGHQFKREYFRYFGTDGDQFVLHNPGDDTRIPASRCIVFQTCDVAGSLSASADYFVIGTWAITPHRDLLLLDIIRTRIEGPDQPDLLTQAFHRWRPALQGIESNGIGKTAYQTMVRSGLPVVELLADRDKALRAIPIASRYKAGAVYHPEHAAWLSEYEEELAGFPNAPHDDQVDVAAYAAIILADLEELLGSHEGEVVTYGEEVNISPV